MAGATGVPVNPMQQASLAQQGALAGTAGAGTIAGTNLSPYTNPYESQVIGATQADIMRNAQMAANALDYQAGRAGAFGGSRHGVALGEFGKGVMQNLGSQTAAMRQQGYQNAQEMAQKDIQNRMLQAAQLGNLGQQSFGYGQQIQSGLAQQGQAQQALQQAMIDAAKAQYAGYQNAPVSSLGYVSAALGATPVPMSSTQQTTGGAQRQPGLFDYLTLGATAFGNSDVRLKESIKKVGELANGIGIYTWKWTKEAIEAGKSSSMLKGVLAQEVRKVLPEAVIVDKDGYMKVNYAHPELKGAF
jgi:hypothetical protein